MLRWVESFKMSRQLSRLPMFLHESVRSAILKMWMYHCIYHIMLDVVYIQYLALYHWRIWAHCTITLSRIITNRSNIMKNCMWCRYRILGEGHIFCILKSLFTWGRWSSMYETMHKYATMRLCAIMRLCATMQLCAPMRNYASMHLCINMHGYMRSFQETSPEFLWFPWWGWAGWPPALRFESFACFALVAWLPPV